MVEPAGGDGPGAGRGALAGASSMRERVRRFVARRLFVLAIAAAMVVAFERLWPGLLHTESRALSYLTFVAFLLRTFEFHMGLGIAALFALALVVRGWRAAGVLAVCAAVTLGPVAWSCVPSARARAAQRSLVAADAPSPLRMLAINLLYLHAENDRALDEIRRIDPDVICFIEYTPGARAFFEGAFGAEYPYRVHEERGHPYGAAVYSRLELVDEHGRTRAESGRDGWAPDVDESGGFEQPQPRVVVRHEGKNVAVRAVHLTSPGGPGNAAEQRLEIPRLIALAERDAATFDAVVLAGDFNATPNSAHLGALRREGLRESAADLGLGRATTWPRISVFSYVPNVRLDHVVASGELAFVGGGRTEDFGSDHRGVWADVVLAGAGIENKPDPASPVVPVDERP